MGHASKYENISERYFENAPIAVIYGITDTHDSLDDFDPDDTVARDIQNFRARIEAFALTKATPQNNLREVEKLYAMNEKWRNECDDIHSHMTDENAEYSMEKINYRERAIAGNLRKIVLLTLSPTQIFNAASYERRLMKRSPRKSYCYADKTDLLENAENYCIDCGGIKCDCGHCFCNWGYV
jgi:hypothetical protein